MCILHLIKGGRGCSGSWDTNAKAESTKPKKILRDRKVTMTRNAAGMLVWTRAWDLVKEVVGSLAGPKVKSQENQKTDHNLLMPRKFNCVIVSCPKLEASFM